MQHTDDGLHSERQLRQPLDRPRTVFRSVSCRKNLHVRYPLPTKCRQAVQKTNCRLQFPSVESCMVGRCGCHLTHTAEYPTAHTTHGRETPRFSSDSPFYSHRMFHGLCGMVVYFIWSRGKRPTRFYPASQIRLERMRTLQVALQRESDYQKHFSEVHSKTKTMPFTKNSSEDSRTRSLAVRYFRTHPTGHSAMT